ncbi:hypothetical protein J2T15_001758 [Paenibacillus harenae]|uniref:DUF2577 domain-containing protein n=2 Tax=Paenibacillus harenae TaxID=306543 RepID=A0ABT9TYD4_PAEHA|nr:hypothetical protein [Paenibacillus harenae]
MSLGDLIKLHSMNSVRSLRMLELMEAEVVSAPPELQLKLKGNDKLIIPKELIVVAGHLCETKRKVHLNRASKTAEEKESSMAVGKASFDMTLTEMLHAIPPPAVDEMHSHESKVEVALLDQSFAMTEGELHYINDDKEDDLLMKGDKVMVASFEGGQKFFVIDRVVHY